MSKPLYKQIAEALKQQIANGILAPGALLPTELELQQSFQASRVTVRNAMALLVEADLVHRVRGSGTYVKKAHVHHDANQIAPFSREVLAKGKQPTTRVVEFSLREADASQAEHLQVEEGTMIYRVIRVRSIDGEPEIAEKIYMPLDLFPDLNIQVMQGSKYDYVEKTRGLRIGGKHQRLSPLIPRPEVAKLLNLSSGEPVLKSLSVGRLSDGRPFEYTIGYFRCEQFVFELESRRLAD